MPPFRARGFGLDWQSDIALEQFDPLAAPCGAADIVVARVDKLADRPAPRPINRGAVFDDGFRFDWNGEATFDVFDGDRIEYCSGPRWSGGLPAAFYSTVAGLTLTWRGFLSFHASAFELSGRAFLLAGRAGAGKSTLAAELMQAGARLISDDLTVLGRGNDGVAPVAYRGRQAMRLHPQTAMTIDALRCEEVPEDPRGKVLVWPRARADEGALPVAGLILLGDSAGPVPGPVPGVELAPLLPRLLFRPAWMASLPGRLVNRAQLVELAQQMPAWRLPRVCGFSPEAQAQRIAAVLDAVAGLAG